jgi:Flp pilus assembly protein TadD
VEYEALVKRQPASVSAQTFIGMILEAQNKTDDARRQYEKVLGLDANAGVAANNLAWLYATRGQNLDVALRLAETAKARLPAQPEVDDTLGYIYYLKDLPELAVRPLLQSAQADPRNPMPQYHLGLAYAKIGNTSRAREALERALALKPEFQGSDEARKILAALGQ